jgi:hypothetical protein
VIAAPDDGVAAYRAAHPAALDTVTAPPNGAGPGGPVTTVDAKTVKATGTEYNLTPTPTPKQYLPPAGNAGA